MRRIRHVVIVLCLALASSAVADPRIVNGVYTSLYPSTGALLLGNDPSTAITWCSGTLIGCDTFLTAAHCVCDDTGPDCQSLDPASRMVFLQHAGFFQLASIAVRPDFDFPVGDVAVLKLATPVTAIRPSPIARTAPAIGTAGTIVGFGRSGGGSQDYGLKRAASVTTAACSLDISDTTSVCWNFTGPGGNTCNGDSGGPLFVGSGGSVAVAGVTSGGSSNSCLPTDNSFDANVAHYAKYIAQQGGSDLDQISCGAGPQAGDPGATITGIVGALSAAVPEELQAFTVTPGTQELRLAMNAVDDGTSDFDLYVKHGAAPTPSDFDCRQDGPSQFGFCDFPAPAAGIWYILVQRFSGEGTYQLTATTIGGQLPVCGDGVREGSEQCDGVDDLACPGFCDAGCTCSPACNDTDLAVTTLRTNRGLSVRLILANTGGTYDGLDPRTSPLTLVLDDGGSPAAITIPANDLGWEGSNPAHGSYRWRGDGTLAGLRRITIRDKSTSRGRFELRFTGRIAPAVNPAGTRVTLALGGVCVASAP
jgi:hypothetical protein